MLLFLLFFSPIEMDGLKVFFDLLFYRRTMSNGVNKIKVSRPITICVPLFFLHGTRLVCSGPCLV